MKTQIDHVKMRLILRAEGPDEAMHLLRLPSRRWMAKMGCFIAPWTRMNMQVLHEMQVKGQVTLDQEAAALVEEKAKSTLGDREFPSWYSHKLEPFPDQERALKKTYKNNVGALLMRMGTGKSKVFIDSATAHFQEGRIEAVMLILPLTVTGVWMGDRGELATHSAIPYEIIEGNASFRADQALAAVRRNGKRMLTWILVGIESLSQGRAFEKLMPFIRGAQCAVFVDESSRIANHSTIRTGRVYELGGGAKVRMIGTGTPVRKNLVNLFSQFQFLDPNIIGVGDYYAFRNRYCVMGGFKNKKIVTYNKVEELMSLIEPYTYRCDKPEGMPEQTWVRRDIKLTDVQADFYKRMKKGLVEGVTVANILTKMLRLQQIVGGFYSDDPVKIQDPLTGRVKVVKGKENRIVEASKNPKILEILDILEEEGDRPIIIWSRFQFEIEDLMSILPKYGRCARFDGSVPTPERMRIKEDFQDGKYDFLIGNQTVGGIGYTFHRSHITIYNSNTDSLEDRLQSEDRTHRRGQNENCLYIDLVAEKTVDVARMAAIADKKDLDQWVRDKLDEAGGRMTKYDLLLGEI